MRTTRTCQAVNCTFLNSVYYDHFKSFYKFAIILLLTFCTSLLEAQIQHIDRMEIADHTRDHEIHLVNMKEQGFYLFPTDLVKDKKHTTYTIQHFNNELKATKKRNYTIPNGYSFIGSCESNAILYQLFLSPKGKWICHFINEASAEASSVSFDVSRKLQVHDFTVLNHHLFISVDIKHEAHVIVCSLETGDKNIVPIRIGDYSAKNIYVEKIQRISASAEVLFFVKVKKNRVLNTYILSFDQNGKLNQPFHLSAGLKNKLLDVTCSYYKDNTYMFSGTFSSDNQLIPNGVFICKTNDGIRQFINYHHFLDIEGFIDYLPEKEQRLIAKRKAYSDKKGKVLHLDYHLASHNIRYIDDHFVFIGEAYHPTYKNELRNKYINGRVIFMEEKVFDGFEYTHAIMVGFNTDGKHVWDHSFQMHPDSKPIKETKFINASFNHKNVIKLLYSSNNDIHSTTVSADGIILKDNVYKSLEVNQNMSVRSTTAKVEYWYGHHFLAFGTQRVILETPNMKKSKVKKNIFFVNNISY